MGKRSTRENKNIYQLSREAMGFTREKAAEEMEIISDDRIEKIESERSLPHPDEILLMSRCYHAPDLCNYYCSHECPIGRLYVPEVRPQELGQIALEAASTLNRLQKEKDRLIDIAVDGAISEDEKEDFLRIREQLMQLSSTATALRLWVEK